MQNMNLLSLMMCLEMMYTDDNDNNDANNNAGWKHSLIAEAELAISPN